MAALDINNIDIQRTISRKLLKFIVCEVPLFLPRILIYYLKKVKRPQFNQKTTNLI